MLSKLISITSLVLLLGNSTKVWGAEPVNLAKSFENNTVVNARFLHSGGYISLEKRNNKHIYRLNQGEQHETTLPWKPTHMQTHAKTQSVVFASLDANGHPNAQNALLLYKESEKMLALDKVTSFRLSASGEVLFVLRVLNSQLTGEVYNLQGQKMAQRTWGSGAGAIAYSISPDGKLFLPKPQSPDIEKWTSIKAFSGENLKTELRYSFGEYGVLDALAFNNNKVLISVAGAVRLFEKERQVWQLEAKFNGIIIDQLRLSDNTEYFVASDTHSNSFYVADLTGQIRIEHNDHVNANAADKLNFLPLRISNKGLPFIRDYQIQGEHLVITDKTANKIYLVNLTTKKHKVIANTKALFDISVKTGQKLVYDNAKLSVQSI